MSEYPQGRPNGMRPNDYGHAAPTSREAAFNNIFGSAPPPGRSQTMTSTSFNPNAIPQGRTQTMTSHSPGMPNGMQRPPPPRQQPRQQPNGYGHAPPMAGNMPNGGYPQNGYYADQRQPSGGAQVQSQPQPQRLPQPQRPDRRYGAVPQRIDERGPHPQYPTTRPIPQRYGQGPAPALNSDSYRSQSMASISRPVFHAPPNNYPQQAPANAFRQAPYQQSSGTTAQGRIVPQRHDERAMSMTNHPQQHDIHQHQQQQMSSGRVIPARRTSQSGPAEMQGSNGYDYGRTMSMASTTAGDASRTMSMASTIIPPDALAHRPSNSKSVGSGNGGRHFAKAPLVYPALLSRVGECFRQRVAMEDKVGESGLIYKNAFSGSEAVDQLSFIIKTTDRNLALLLGRSLDAQRFFHHVTYLHRLRDSASEIYQFRETAMDGQSDGPEVNGVFVLLSECYSPTCTKDSLCYSIACPKRLEQQSRLNLKPQGGLRRQESQASLHDEPDEPDEQKLWINTVSPEIANSVSDREKKRQEVISEIMYTERDFVKDIEYLRDFWIVPLLTGTPMAQSPIPEQRREKIVKTVFSNIIDHPSIHAVSSRFAEALTERQKKQPVVYQVGDIFLDFVPKFDPFIHYGANQLAAKHEYEKERLLNPYFARFADETERRKESRKLELNGYLTKPTTRLARYPLLLDNVLKYTEPGNPDIENLPKALKMVREFLTRVNEESGKSENRFNLKQLHENLRWKNNERVDLKLTDEGRELLNKGALKKAPNDPGEITTYLFDHAVLFVRTKVIGKKEEVKVYRRPIPLELLHIKEMEEVIPKPPQPGISKRPSSSLLPAKSNVSDASKKEFPITFSKIGRFAYEITLYASTASNRKKWLELIGEQQEKLKLQGHFYNQNEISAGFFSMSNRVNCVAPFDGGRKLIYGTDNGIYVSDRRNKDLSVKPRKALETQNVVQIDVLEEYQLILVLANKSLYSYALSALDPNEAALNKRPKKIQGHCNFFKTGVCLGRHLVCCVKSSALSTTIKVFEPNDAMSKGKKQKNFFNLKTGGPDELKSFKEFYIPTESSSIHFLKSKLCVACARGFEVVSLETLETQSLLDQADTSLDFVARKEGNVRPIHLERLNGEFLLNYSDFSFFVNRNGWRARPEWRIDWEGQPQNFALMYPWILAFEPNFIEIRNIEDNAVHIVQGKNIRMLHSSTREILYGYEDDRGGDVVASIDFWPAEQQLAHPPRTASQAPPTQSRR